jgi:small subunit ribosomal protein S13
VVFPLELARGVALGSEKQPEVSRTFRAVADRIPVPCSAVDDQRLIAQDGKSGSLITVCIVLTYIGVSQRLQLHRGDACKGTSCRRALTVAHLTSLQRSLETFFGIGPKVSQGLMAKFHIHPWAKLGTLKNSTVMDLTTEMSNMKIENDLRREVQDSIRRLKDMGTYRGRRHAMGLPVRGQRTRTQVCDGNVACECRWVLTMIDQYGKKVEPDGTRRAGKGAVVVWRDLYFVLYYTARTKMHETALVNRTTFKQVKVFLADDGDVYRAFSAVSVFVSEG